MSKNYYQKKKNALIVVFMVLLVALVALICYIFIYAKLNPPREFVSQDDIAILQMQSIDYKQLATTTYSPVQSFENFDIIDGEENVTLTLTNEKVIKLLRNDELESIEIMLNDNNINTNIKTIYQTANEGLILTDDGNLYKLVDNKLEDGKLRVGQILTNMEVKEIVNLNLVTDYIYVLTGDSKLINVNTQKEYNGVVEEIKTSTSTIYVYENYSFGLEEGKIFVDQNNLPLKINISFDNKIITDSNVIYEINSSDNNLYTSKLGEYEKVWYKYKDGESIYDVAVLSNTGLNEVRSTYYYSK